MTTVSPVSYDVSVITPIHNAALFLDAAFESLQHQTFTGSIELCLFDDGSCDNSRQLVNEWKTKLEKSGISVVFSGDVICRGQGYARNRAIEGSSGRFLCFLDADDVMTTDRIQKQHDAAVSNPTAIIGSRFIREPADSTARYTAWANRLTDEQLYTQVYTSHGPTMILPTWFCSRRVYNAVGKFVESGPGTPEDYIFYLHHLELGGHLICLPDVLLTYRYHQNSVTSIISEQTIMAVRMDAIQRLVIEAWNGFTIWNAGKQGRRFYRELSSKNRKKVMAFCDVDPKKIAKGFYIYENYKEDVDTHLYHMDGSHGEEETDYTNSRHQIHRKAKRHPPKIPIVHFSDAKPPFVICMKLDLTGGEFERNLSSLSLVEGQDFYHFN